MSKTQRTALGFLLFAVVAGCGIDTGAAGPGQPALLEATGLPSPTVSPDPMPSSLDVPADPPATLPHYPDDLTREEIAALQAEEERINALEAARPPDTGPLYSIVLYIHRTETLDEAVGVAEVIVVGTVTGVQWGVWREVAGRSERDRFLLIEVEQVLDGDVEEGATIRLRDYGETVVRGVLREHREGLGAVHLGEGDRALLLLSFDPRTQAYGKISLDAVQRLHDGRVERSERTTVLSRTVEDFTEKALLNRLETAIRARQED